VTYNREDCQALRLLIEELLTIKDKAKLIDDLNWGDRHKSFDAKVDNPLHDQLESILKFANAKYDKNKIKFRQHNEIANNIQGRKVVQPKENPRRQTREQLQTTEIVFLPQGEFCPKCENSPLLPSKETSERMIVDFVPTSSGVRRTVTKYVGAKGYCPKCRVYRIAPDMHKFARSQLYGHGFKAWFIYYRVALHLSYQNIIDMTEEQFKIRMNKLQVFLFLKEFARFYKPTERDIIQSLLNSSFIHIDETEVSIEGANWYVWVFTDGKHVAFKLTETRETNIIHELLADYEGVLISDFYSGYDSVKCRQQKCWVHLIRDINDDLWKTPYDTEFEHFVFEVRDLIVPIMEVVQMYGLKKCSLAKFSEKVNSFYDRIITEKRYKSDLAIKYQKRFKKYRDSLFTFLQEDGIPWHNNTAETAIRHIAIQRKISGHFYEAITHDYLVLLGIKQTCRFQEKSFFRFLFSGETDLNKFEVG
jgi:hypothetical protein